VCVYVCVNEKISTFLILENCYFLSRGNIVLCRYRGILGDGVLRYSEFPGRDGSGAALRRNRKSSSAEVVTTLSRISGYERRRQLSDCVTFRKIANIARLIKVFSERELTFTFAICCRPSVCRLSVTFVHPTQPIEIFGNVSTPFGTLAIH